MIAKIPGTVFAVGDLAYPNGSDEFSDPAATITKKQAENTQYATDRVA